MQNKIYERVYIHATKIRVKEDWALFLCSMDEDSEFAFKPVIKITTEINIDDLNQLFDNILKGYNPKINPKQIVFITSLPEEYGVLFLLTKAANHKFIHDKDATIKGMKGFLSSMNFEIFEL